MSISGDIQTLNPGALISLFELDGTTLGAGINRFHGYTQLGSIWWQGNEYVPWPIQALNFARTTDQQPTPNIAVGNIDGSISTLCEQFDDFVGAKLTRRRTLGKYLDAVNFDGGNPDANPDEFLPDEVWFVERKAAEDSTQVQWELSSALDLDGRQLPGRQIVANLCNWLTIGGYRGPYCNYSGPPVAMADDTPTSDADLDACSGHVSGCKLRFGAHGQLNFGGFPGAGLIRTS